MKFKFGTHTLQFYDEVCPHCGEKKVFTSAEISAPFCINCNQHPKTTWKVWYKKSHVRLQKIYKLELLKYIKEL